jgi:hypothetical protein
VLQLSPQIIIIIIIIILSDSLYLCSTFIVYADKN